MSHPEPSVFPTGAWSDWLSGRVDGLLHQARANLAVLKDGTPRTAEAVLELWNDADIALAGAGAVTALLSEVHDCLRLVAPEQIG